MEQILYYSGKNTVENVLYTVEKVTVDNVLYYSRKTYSVKNIILQWTFFKIAVENVIVEKVLNYSW